MSKKSATPLRNQVVTSCPEHIVLREGKGKSTQFIELTTPCGRADCISSACRAEARRRAKLAEIRAVPNLFGPEMRRSGSVTVSREEMLASLARLEPLAQVIPFPSPALEDMPGMGERAVTELLGELTGTDG